MQTPSLSQAVDGGELLSLLEKRRQRLARRLKQAAFGVYLKKSAHQLPASVNSGDEMNLGDQLYSRAFQLAARDKHLEASRLRELTAQLENSHLTTSDDGDGGGDVSAVLRFLILLTDSKNMSAVSRSSNGLVEIGSSVPMHNGSNQLLLSLHTVPIYGQRLAFNSGHKAYMQYPSRLFLVPVRPRSAVSSDAGRGFPVYTLSDFRLSAAARDRATREPAWGPAGRKPSTHEHPQSTADIQVGVFLHQKISVPYIFKQGSTAPVHAK